MRKLWVGACGLAVMFVALDVSPCAAQSKKETTKKADATPAATIDIKVGKDGKFRFTIRDADGKLLAMSGPSGFATSDDAAEAIATLKAAIVKAKVSVEDSKTDAKTDSKTKSK